MVVYISFYSDDTELELSILDLVSRLRSQGVEVELALYNSIEIEREGVPHWCERMYQKCGKMLVIVSPKYLEVNPLQVTSDIHFQ